MKSTNCCFSIFLRRVSFRDGGKKGFWKYAQGSLAGKGGDVNIPGLLCWAVWLGKLLV